MNFKMCGGLFSFCFLYETVFGNGQVAITHNKRIVVLSYSSQKDTLFQARRKNKLFLQV